MVKSRASISLVLSRHLIFNKCSPKEPSIILTWFFLLFEAFNMDVDNITLPTIIEGVRQMVEHIHECIGLPSSPVQVGNTPEESYINTMNWIHQTVTNLAGYQEKYWYPWPCRSTSLTPRTLTKT